ncbi:NeuD/PglB/VioB family sugar acetyltransferase [Rothia sp. ARF10]|nr:NeuD/PglB/VioB family sugar acetyltransferase [Rothia sp. ARF10]
MTRGRGPLLLVGASGLAAEVAECARRLGREVVGCLDDDPSRVGEILPGGVPVLGTTDGFTTFDVLSQQGPLEVVVTIGHGSVRCRVVQRLLASGVTADRFATVVDPQTVLPPTTTVGAGSVLLAGVVVTAPVSIGHHVVVMPHVTLTHDVVVEDYVTMASGVGLGGGVRVRAEAYLGMSSAVRQGITVGYAATLGMGATLLEDLPDGETWVGTPARRLRGPRRTVGG